MTPAHISERPHRSQLGGSGLRSMASVEPDGLCHCHPQPDSDSWGQCPRCLRLDVRKAMAR